MSKMVVRIGGDATGFKKALDGVKGQAAGVGKSIAGAISPGLAAGGIAGVATGFAMLAKKAAAAADAIDQGAKRVGMSAGDYQELSQAAMLGGGSIEQIETAIKKMSNVLGDDTEQNRKKIAALGLSFDDLKGKTPKDQFIELSHAISAISDPTQRLAAATDIFGGSAKELIPLITNIDGSLVDARSRFVSMSEEAVAAGARIEDSFDALGTNIQNTVANTILPALADWSEGLEAILGGNERLAKSKGVIGGGDDPYAAIDAADMEKYQQEFQKRKDATAAAQKRDAEKQAADAEAERVAEVKKFKESPEFEKSQLEREIKLQEMLNDGKEKEVYIARQLLEMQNKLNRNLTDTEANNAKIDAAEKYDLEKKLADLKEKPKADTVAASIDRMDEELYFQELKNKKMDRELAIARQIAEVERSSGRKLTADEKEQIAAKTGDLFDMQQGSEATAKTRTYDPQVTSLERIGAIMGGGSTAKPETRELRNIAGTGKETVRILKQIYEKSGDISLGVV